MRVLFIPEPFPAHLYPMVPLAWAFRVAGHDVRIAAQPRLMDEITRCGLPAVRVGNTVGLTEGDRVISQARSMQMTGARQSAAPHLGGPREPTQEERLRIRSMLFGAWARSAESIAADLLALAHQWQPDLLVTDPVAFAGMLAAGATGIPLVRHLWGLDVFGPLGQSAPAVADKDAGAKWPRGLADLFDRYDVDAREVRLVCTVDPCPASMQTRLAADRVPVRYVPYNGAGVVPEWLSTPSRRPRICVTWSMAATGPVGREAFLVPEIITALAELDVEVVATVAAADRRLVGESTDRIRIVESMPLSLLLPSCDAVINAGGAGTILTAAAYGVPQVVIPQVGEQPDNAARLASTGAGIALNADQADIPGIRHAASAVLSDHALRTAARRLQEEILAQPTPAEVVGIIERLL